MKKILSFFAAAITAGLALNSIQAQDLPFFGGTGGGDPEFLRNQPFMSAIDTDGNLEISFDEVENSVESLSALDANGNGDLDYGVLS